MKPKNEEVANKVSQEQIDSCIEILENLVGFPRKLEGRAFRSNLFIGENR